MFLNLFLGIPINMDQMKKMELQIFVLLLCLTIASCYQLSGIDLGVKLNHVAEEALGGDVIEVKYHHMFLSEIQRMNQMASICSCLTLELFGAVVRWVWRGQNCKAAKSSSTQALKIDGWQAQSWCWTQTDKCFLILRRFSVNLQTFLTV